MISRFRWVWWTAHSWWHTTRLYLTYITIRMDLQERRNSQ